MIGWFPRLSPDGQQIITQEPGRYGPVWIDNSAYAYKVGNGPGIKVSTGGNAWDDWQEPISLAGGGGLFAAECWSAKLEEYRGVRLSNTLQFDEAYHPAMAEDGYLVFLRGHNQQVQELTDAAGKVYDHSAPMEYPSASTGGVAWSRYTRGALKETWYAPRGGAKSRVHASGTETIEFLPQVVTTPHGDWIATYTNTDVRLYPVGSTLGYLYPSDNARAVDAQWDGATIRVVWNSPSGDILDVRQDVNAPRVNLEAPVIPPVDPPPVDPPPVEPPMDFPRSEWTVVEQMHVRFSDMFPQTEDGARDWTEMTIEQLAFQFSQGGWCWKKQTSTNPPSKDCIARQFEGRFEGWDVLSAAGDHGPKNLATYPPQYHDLAGQVPIVVIGLDHLGDEPEPPATHPYDGGDNDTGICDVCGKPKADPIHTPIVPPDEDLEEAVADLQLDMGIVQANVIKQAQRITALEQAPPSGGVTVEQVNALIKAALDGGAVDGDLRKRFYTLVGKLRESKSTSRSFGHSHSIKVYEGDL